MPAVSHESPARSGGIEQNQLPEPPARMMRRPSLQLPDSDARARGAPWRAAVLLAGAWLCGCEAPLDLQGVAARRAEPLRRSDLFQQAAAVGGALVVVGNHGVVLRSADAGATWSRLEIEGWPALIDVAACDGGRFAALATEGQVFVSDDAGQRWVAKPLPTEEPPQAISCDPGNRLWVVGSFATILVSEDGGDSWDDRSLGDDTIFTTIQFIDAQHAVVFGEFGANLWSDDGGASWRSGEPLADDFYVQDALFTDRDSGWVAGLAGQILHTGDGGKSWVRQDTPTLAPVYALAADAMGVYAAGGEGVLMRYEPGGWRRLEHGRPIRLFLRVLQPLAAGKLLIGGAAGALYVVPAGGGAGA